MYQLFNKDQINYSRTPYYQKFVLNYYLIKLQNVAALHLILHPTYNKTQGKILFCSPTPLKLQDLER